MQLRLRFPNFDADATFAVLEALSLQSRAGDAAAAAADDDNAAAAASTAEDDDRLHVDATGGIDGGFVSCSSMPPLADNLLLPGARRPA
jgi:hypothetical protein